jgi:hypothetical protein
VVALLIALAAERWWPAGTRPRIEPALRIALAAFVAVEAARWVQRPGLALDGDPAGPQDPVARSDHADHRLKVD